MKKQFFVALLLFTTAASRGISPPACATENSTFSITDKGSVSDSKPYEEAIKKADMEIYRCKTKRNTIVFDNGLKVELISAAEMFALGMKVSINDYSDTRAPHFIQPIFHLNDNGTLSAMYTKPDMKQHTSNPK